MAKTNLTKTFQRKEKKGNNITQENEQKIRW